MAAEFVFSPPAGGGGSPTPGGQSKKKGINKTYLYIGGGLVIMLYIIFIKRTSTQAPVTDQTTTGYPTNTVDVASQLQNNADILQGNMNATLNQFQAEMAANYGSQLQAIQNKLDGMQGADNNSSHPNPDFIVRTGDYTNSADAVKAQNEMIAQGLDSAIIQKKSNVNGYAGQRDYYYVQGFTSDQNKALTTGADLRQKGLTFNVQQATTDPANSPAKGTIYSNA
jgi:hypothetical protein